MKGDTRVIEFEEHGATYVGTDARRRWWRIIPVRAGWRLDYRDPGDDSVWRAGVFGDLAAAQTEANRDYGSSLRPRSAPTGRPAR